MTQKQSSKALARAENFMDEFNLQIPILLAPMPNATPPELAAAISNKGGMGAVEPFFLEQKKFGLGLMICAHNQTVFFN